jgi:hypothetical protein
LRPAPAWPAEHNGAGPPAPHGPPPQRPAPLRSGRPLGPEARRGAAVPASQREAGGARRLLASGRRHVWPQGAARLLGSGVTRQRGAAACLDGFALGAPLCAPLLVDRARGRGAAGLGGAQPPARRHAASGRREPTRAIARPEGPPRLRGGRRHRGSRVRPGRGDPGAPRTARRGQPLPLLFTVQSPSRHEGRRAVGRLPRRDVRRDDVPAVPGSAGMAATRRPAPRHPGLGLHTPVPHDWGAVGAMSPAVAPRHRQDRRRRLRGTVGAAIDVATRAVQRRHLRGAPQALGGADGTQRLAGRYPIGLARRPGAPNGLIRAGRGCDPRGDAPVGRLGRKKSGHAVQLLGHNAPAVEDHGLDGMADGDHARLAVLPGGLVNDGAAAKCITPPGHQAEMIQDLTARGRWPRIDSSGEELLPPGQHSGHHLGAVRKVGSTRKRCQQRSLKS